MSPDDKEELKEIVQEFHNEIEDGRDESKIKELLSRAQEYSVDVAAKMGILALQYGLVGAVLN